MNNLTCVIFDLDGTLTQTNELIYATFNHVSGKYTGKTYSPEEIVKMFGPPEEVAIERLVGSGNIEVAMADFNEFYLHHLPKMAETYDGIKELLKFLKQRNVTLAIFTGKGSTTALMTLEHFGIRQYFDMVVSGTDVTDHKPSAEGIRKIMQELDRGPEEVLMVGDAVADVKAAHEAGVSIAAVLWDSYGKDSVLSMEVDYFFHSVAEFDGWLRLRFAEGGDVAR